MHTFQIAQMPVSSLQASARNTDLDCITLPWRILRKRHESSEFWW